MRAFHIARTGMQVQEKRLAVKSQNLAAQGVEGYKRQSMISQDLPYDYEASSPDSPIGLNIGLGVMVAGTARIFSTGDFVKTDAPFNMAIAGDGWFEVTMDDGTTAYTRSGAFEKNSEGQVVSMVGNYQLAPGITVPQNAVGVSIEGNGEVFVTIPGSPSTQQLIGQVQLVRFNNNNGLRAIGENLFVQTAKSGAPQPGVPGVDGLGKLRQGYLESSNVDSVEEITTMMMIQRIYELLTKVFSTGERMMDAASSNIARS
jgi:flagellar basal-body rod protein FlgG